MLVIHSKCTKKINALQYLLVVILFVFPKMT